MRSPPCLPLGFALGGGPPGGLPEGAGAAGAVLFAAGFSSFFPAFLLRFFLASAGLAGTSSFWDVVGVKTRRLKLKVLLKLISISSKSIAFFTLAHNQDVERLWLLPEASMALSTLDFVKRRQGDVPWDAVHRTLQL